MQLSDMRQNACKSHISASLMPSPAFLAPPSTPSNGSAKPAWDEEASDRGGPIDKEEASLERLRVVVTELFKAISNALQDERESAKECIQRASTVLQTDPTFRIFGSEVQFLNDARPKPIRGGLAPWQIRRVTTHIEANLDATIRINDLATLMRLSSFHFCRAFRNSFGDSPHGYVMRRRVERAQGLMLTTNASLVQIAAECGLADQAHLYKLFRRFVGESPGAWRRARTTARTYYSRSP
jgi:AraC family transcriptional regulator